jgi:hypothetical protein
MMRARMIFCGPHAQKVGKSLEPDNMPNMKLDISEGRFCMEFSALNIGTLLATSDDILMNIKIAEETIISAEEK